MSKAPFTCLSQRRLWHSTLRYITEAILKDRNLNQGVSKRAWVT